VINCMAVVILLTKAGLISTLIDMIDKTKMPRSMMKSRLMTITSINVEIRPAFVSKITTAMQLITVLLVLSIPCFHIEINEMWIQAAYWITAVLTILSGLNYILRGMELINHDT